MLWYISTIATRFELRLEKIASSNLRKTALRWPPATGGLTSAPHFYDDHFPPRQRIPRKFSVDFKEETDRRRIRRVRIYRNGHPIGDRLGDNAHIEDGYRFHDVFHLAYAAVLDGRRLLESCSVANARAIGRLTRLKTAGEQQ